jgi:hypothetical protein
MAGHGSFAAGGLAGRLAHGRAALCRVLGFLGQQCAVGLPGWQDEAWALIVLNVCLALMNVPDIVKNELA